MKVAKESKVTNWLKVEDSILTQCFVIYYPDIDPGVIKLTKAQMAAMLERSAGKKNPEEVIAEYNTRQTKKAASLPSEFLALTFPDGIQDALNRVGTRVVVAEKYPDTTAGKIRAASDLHTRLNRAKLTLAQALAMPIKEKATREAGQRWVVTPFAIDDRSACPGWAADVVTALVGLDPEAQFGKRQGKKAGILVRLPKVTGKFNVTINLPPEFAVAASE